MKISAVVVTYNRKKLLVECLESLKNQTYPLNAIYLIDNASNDNTSQYLLEKGYISKLPEFRNDVYEDFNKIYYKDRIIDLFYIRMPKNIGGAGGFYEGVKRGYNKGYDWLWLMDDDAEPLSDSLEKLIKAVSIYPEAVAFSNLKISVDGIPQYGHRGWKDVYGLNKRFIKRITEDDIKSSYLKIDHSSFVGLMISKTAVEKVGFPNSSFFIQFDDVEYCFRLRGFGEIVLVTSSKIVHKDQSSQIRKKRNILFFKVSTPIPYESLWLKYYGFRNMVYLKKKYCGFMLAFIVGFKVLIKKILSILFQSDRKYKRVVFYINAFLDGLTEKFDNEKPKMILYK